jgi:hypothetical protein
VESYEGKLGLSMIRTGADGSKVYATGGDASLVVYPSPDHAGGSTATLVTWCVDDVEEMVDELTSKGVTFERYEECSRAASTMGPTSGGSHPAPAAAKWPGSRIPAATSSRSRAGPAWAIAMGTCCRRG